MIRNAMYFAFKNCTEKKGKKKKDKNWLIGLVNRDSNPDLLYIGPLLYPLDYSGHQIHSR